MPAHRLRGLPALFAIAAALLLAVLIPARADAHAELVRADPPAEGLVTVPPRQLELWLSERIASGEGSPAIRVLDDRGTEHAVGAVTLDPNDATHLTASVRDLPPGNLTVVWSVRALDDGHALSGTYGFRIGAGRAPGAATVSGERPPVWAVVTRWLTFLGAALAAGGCAFRLVLLRGLAETDRIRRGRLALASGAVAVALLATLAEPWLEATRPAAGATSSALGDVIAGLPAAWWLRPAALVPCLALLLLARKCSMVTATNGAGLALALAALPGLSLTSHAAARTDWRAPAVAVNTVHQWSIALWVGGLAQLALWWRRREPDGRIEPLRRFSRWALGLVALGVATGVANAGLGLPALRSLWGSNYGVVLLVKVGVLTVPLALATFNRRALRRSLEAFMPAVGRAVRLEAILALLVVLGGSSLALLAPPVTEAERPAAADVAMPALGAYQGQDLLVHLVVTPGRPGENDTRVRLTAFNGGPFTGEQPALVRLAVSSLALAADPTLQEAVPDGSGAWRVTGSRMAFPGWWQIDVTLRWLGQPDVTVPYYLLLPDPNLNGLDAPGDDPASDPAAAALYERAMALYTGMHRVRYAQAMASHVGGVSYGVHVVNDGADGSVPGFTFDIPGGWHYIVLGETSWSQLPGEAWEQADANPMIPPSEWDEEYIGARGFRFGRTEVVDGEPCRVLTFVVPGTPTQIVAWYVWWVGEETGYVRREMMISQSHYMISRFSDFDAPLTITPPETAATPAAAS